MNIEEFLKYKKENPEPDPDFSFSVSRLECQQHSDTREPDVEIANSLFNSICQTQNQDYKRGTRVPKLERIDLKIFIS